MVFLLLELPDKTPKIKLLVSFSQLLSNERNLVMLGLKKVF